MTSAIRSKPRASSALNAGAATITIDTHCVGDVDDHDAARDDGHKIGCPCEGKAAISSSGTDRPYGVYRQEGSDENGVNSPVNDEEVKSHRERQQCAGKNRVRVAKFD